MGAVFKKEIKTYFTTMTGYVFLGLFLLLTGFYFCGNCVFGGSANIVDVLSLTLVAFLVLIPVLTMRLFAEETRQRTDQLLFTSPISILQIVIEKFAAAAALLLIGIGITACYSLILIHYDVNGVFSIAQTVTGIVGYFLMGCCFISIGLFISVLTDNQIIAAVGTFAAMFFIIMVDSLSDILPATTSANIKFVGILIVLTALFVYNSTKNIFAPVIFAVLGFIAETAVYFINKSLFDGVMTKVLSWFSVVTRYRNGFSMGIFNAVDIIYLVTFSAAFIYLSVNTIEKRRWK